MRQNKIPQTDSIQELARFWDSHDVTDFVDEVDEEKETVFERQNPVTVFLEPKESIVVKELAKNQNVTESDLIHEWVVERIHTSSNSIE